jgi:hypothetical protein
MVSNYVHTAGWILQEKRRVESPWTQLDSWSFNPRSAKNEQEIYEAVTDQYLTHPTTTYPLFLRMVCPDGTVVWGWYGKSLRICHPEVHPYSTHGA